MFYLQLRKIVRSIKQPLPTWLVHSPVALNLHLSEALVGWPPLPQQTESSSQSIPMHFLIVSSCSIKTNAFQQPSTFPQGKLAANHRVFLKSEICQSTFNPYEIVPAQVNSFRVLEEELGYCTVKSCHSHSHSHGVKKDQGTMWRHMSTFSLRIELMFPYLCPSGVT